MQPELRRNFDPGCTVSASSMSWKLSLHLSGYTEYNYAAAGCRFRTAGRTLLIFVPGDTKGYFILWKGICSGLFFRGQYKGDWQVFGKRYCKSFFCLFTLFFKPVNDNFTLWDHVTTVNLWRFACGCSVASLTSNLQPELKWSKACVQPCQVVMWEFCRSVITFCNFMWTIQVITV